MSGSVSSAPPTERFRLSPQQERLWTLVERWGHAPFVARCRLELPAAAGADSPELEAALVAVGEHREILRTRFERMPGLALPVQAIEERLRPVVEATAETDGDGASLLDALAAGVAAGDPGEPRLAARLVRTPAGTSLLLAISGLRADGVGVGHLAREVAARLADGASPAPGDLDQEEIQYVDLADWQRDLLESEDTADGRQFWAERGSRWRELSSRWGQDGPRLSLEEPAAPAADEGPWGFRSHPLAVPDTPLDPEAWLAVWTVWLDRSADLWPPDPTAEADAPRLATAVVGDGRRYEELAGAVGPLERHLPLVLGVGELDPGTPFERLAGQLATRRRELEEWQEFLDPAAPEAHGDPPPWVFAPASAADRVGEAVTEPFVARLDLVPAADGDDNVAGAVLRLDARRFSAAAGEILSGRLAALAAAAARAPETPVGELPWLTPAERRLALGERGAAGPSFERSRLLHGLVAEGLSGDPDRVALEAADGRPITAGELAAWAAAVESRLRRCSGLATGAGGAGAVVAVAAERSPELVAALLGVLGSGAAYLPLTQELPAERRAQILADALPAVLLVGPGAEAVEAPEGVERLEIPSAPSELPGERWEPAALPPTSPAYVLYTSGSTGRPKGVVVSHRAITNRLLWMADAHPFGADDRVLHKTPVLFDASIWELFLPLATGARLLLAEIGAEADPAALAREVVDRGVTQLQLVPSLLGPFLDGLAAAGESRIERLFAGGEVLTRSLVERVAQVLPGVALVNLYGPTECSIDATSQAVNPAAPREGGERGPVPIGWPISNATVVVADPRLEPVALDTEGELLVGGDGLAQGYLGQPGQTAAAFVPDPFRRSGDRPGGRLYRTGDLARRRLDGSLLYAGRRDAQVKVRGVRMELDEVAHWIAAHLRVTEAAAALRVDPEGSESTAEPRLVGYAVGQLSAQELATELAPWLADRLPRAMVPTAWVRLPALPRHPSGKLDRGALPEPDPAGAGLGGGMGEGEPRTPTEELLARQWAEVLDVDRLGIHDNVYQLGWHSLMATRLAGRVRRLFGVDLPLRSLFETPTVAGLARRIDAARRGGALAEEPPIEPVDRQGPLPLSFAQQRLWFLDRLEPGSPFYNIPTALEMEGDLDLATLAAAVDAVVARHEVLSTTFALVDDEPVQVIAPPAPLPLPMVDLSALPDALREAEANRQARREALAPFDLERGPLLRSLLVRLDPSRHLGLLTLHHIVADGWSTAVLTHELGVSYAALLDGRRPRLPEPAVQYADVAAWQRSWLSGPVLEAQLAWWREQLDGAPPLLALPTDRPRPAEQSFRGSTVHRSMPGELAQRLQALAHERSATLFMVALAAGATLLGWYSEQRDLVLGSDVAGRTRDETEGLIGFFINQLALRVDLAGSPTFGELLDRVRATTLGAYAHQELPFDRLVEELRPQRDLSAAPIFQAKINLLNVPQPELVLGDLEIRGRTPERATAQFDWILNLIETDDHGLVASVEYATDLFDRSTVERMLAVYESLLEAVVERPEAPLDDLIEVLEETDARERESVRESQTAHLASSLGRFRRRGGAPEAR